MDNFKVPVQCIDKSCNLPYVWGEYTEPVTGNSGSSGRPFNDGDQNLSVPSQASGGRTSSDQEELRITILPIQLRKPGSHLGQYVVSLLHGDLGQDTGPAAGCSGSSVRPLNDWDQSSNVPRQSWGGLTRQDQEELQRLKWERTCKVCLDKWVHVVLIPCGHLVCEECPSKRPSCPLCRGEIQQRFNIYFS